MALTTMQSRACSTSNCIGKWHRQAPSPAVARERELQMFAVGERLCRLAAPDQCEYFLGPEFAFMEFVVAGGGVTQVSLIPKVSNPSSLVTGLCSRRGKLEGSHGGPLCSCLWGIGQEPLPGCAECWESGRKKAAAHLPHPGDGRRIFYGRGTLISSPAPCQTLWQAASRPGATSRNSGFRSTQAALAMEQRRA